MNDFFGRNADELNNIKLWLLDMDGTIYNDETLFDGAAEFLDGITGSGGRYVFITNNSSRSLDAYVSKVTRLGLKADESNFYTSGQAASMMLKRDFPGARVYVQGTKSLVDGLVKDGISVTEEIENDIDVILVGFDTEMTYRKLKNTCRLLQERELPYFATNCDLRCPVSYGYIPDCGSMCQAIENTTGRRPVYIGKPQPDMIYSAMETFGYDRSETAVVGDRIYTDIPAGVNAGVCSICVLSGEATIADIRESDVSPTFVFESIKDIYDGLFKTRNRKQK